MENTVRISEEETDARVLQELVESFEITALGQPDAPGRPAEVLRMGLDRDLDLRANGVRVHHERQEPVGRAAGDDLQLAQVLELPECSYQVPAVLLVKDIPRVHEDVAVHVRDGIELGLVLCAN